MAKKNLPKNVRERDGKYYYRFSIKDTATGKRIQKETKAHATPREAEKAGIRIQSEILLGTYIEEQNISFSDWCDTWLNIYASTGRVKQRTVDIRRESLRIATKEFKGLKLRELTKLQYKKLLDKMKVQGYSRQTIRMLHEAVRMAYQKAVQMGIVATELTMNVDLPGFQKTVAELESEEDLPEFMEKEELSLFLKTAREVGELPDGDMQGYHILSLFAYTGMRIGELCALKTSDVDEINKYISITKTLYDRAPIAEFKLDTPKTKSSIRKIDIGETVLKVLREQTKWRKEFRMSVGAAFYKKEEFVFVNNKKFPGRPVSPRELDKYMKVILEAAKLPLTLTPHSLRHTYTSLMAEAGVELPAIQRLLGHRNDTVTRDVYLHVTKAKKREAVDKLDDLMGSI